MAIGEPAGTFDFDPVLVRQSWQEKPRGIYDFEAPVAKLKCGAGPDRCSGAKCPATDSAVDRRRSE